MALKADPADSSAHASVWWTSSVGVALALGLWGWARGVEREVHAPAVLRPALGWALVGLGVALVAAAAVTLRARGSVLTPALSATERVTGGVFSLLAHPAHVGAWLCCCGLSLVTGSAAGLWLVTPVVALAAAAFVLGAQDVEVSKRGPRTEPVLFHLPIEADTRPGIGERVGALLVVMVPSLFAGKALTALTLSLPVPKPIVWAHVVAAVLLLGALAAAPTRTALRAAVARAWLGLLLVGLVLIAGPGGPWGGTFDARASALLPTIAALAAAPAFRFRVVGAGCVVVALAVQHFAFAPSLTELILTVGAAVVGWALTPLWQVTRRATEWLANSWRDWRIGPLRIINHGVIGAVGCGVGVFALTTLVGPAHAWVVLGVALAGIVGAALWAQVIEGSPSLARPYGFFGGVLGVVAFACAAPLLGTPTWLLLGAAATAAPVIQGVARLRCVANGCCHGAPCASWLGIVYHHPMSRPVRLASLGGVPLHPTQLYSSLSNVVIGAVLVRLWASHASLSFIAGIYLVLMGLFRFVEEAWRGEPQTPVFRGLRLYQWVSFGCVVVGAALSCVPGTAPAPTPVVSGAGLWATLVFMAVTWLIASVDFPESKARFARLA